MLTLTIYHKRRMVNTTSFLDDNVSFPMGIPSDPGDFPFDSAFKAFLSSSSNIVASSSHSFKLSHI